MKVAIQGCVHGRLNDIYGYCAEHAEQKGPVDLLLLCGDFQAIRSRADWASMSVPERHKALGDFWEYYSGQRVAPILTIIVGGNHEASNYMLELFYGGWVAPNMYYLGSAGSVFVNGMRISGSSGIFWEPDYHLGHYERVPFRKRMINSVYHIREYEIVKLTLLPRYSPSVFMSHDWPNGIVHHGNTEDLLKRMPRFRPQVEVDNFGSTPFMPLLKTLQPDSWFAGHMHCCFSATVHHAPDNVAVVNTMPPTTTTDETIVSIDQAESQTAVSAGRTTRFLALDKCGKHDAFIKFLELPAPQPVDGALELTYDPYWLAITRAMYPYISFDRVQKPLPPLDQLQIQVERELRDITENGLLLPDHLQPMVDGAYPLVRKTGPIQVKCVQQFAPTAPHEKSGEFPEPWYANQQTEAFCRMLGIKNEVNPPPEPTGQAN